MQPNGLEFDDLEENTGTKFYLFSQQVCTAWNWNFHMWLLLYLLSLFCLWINIPSAKTNEWNYLLISYFILPFMSQYTSMNTAMAMRISHTIIIHLKGCCNALFRIQSSKMDRWVPLDLNSCLKISTRSFILFCLYANELIHIHEQNWCPFKKNMSMPHWFVHKKSNILERKKEKKT